MFFRRIKSIQTQIISQYRCRCSSFKKMVKTHGVHFGLYYWITNEILVIALTYCLYYDYFGKDFIANLVDRCTPSSWQIDLHHAGEENWSFFGGRMQISPKLVGDFTFASVVMSFVTPLQLPICAATYPWAHKVCINLFSRRGKSHHLATS